MPRQHAHTPCPEPRRTAPLNQLNFTTSISRPKCITTVCTPQTTWVQHEPSALCTCLPPPTTRTMYLHESPNNCSAHTNQRLADLIRDCNATHPSPAHLARATEGLVPAMPAPPMIVHMMTTALVHAHVPQPLGCMHAQQARLQACPGGCASALQRHVQHLLTTTCTPPRLLMQMQPRQHSLLLCTASAHLAQLAGLSQAQRCTSTDHNCPAAGHIRHSTQRAAHALASAVATQQARRPHSCAAVIHSRTPLTATQAASTHRHTPALTALCAAAASCLAPHTRRTLGLYLMLSCTLLSTS